MSKDWIKISKTPPRYRFILSTENGGDGRAMVLHTAPIEWNDGNLEMERDLEVGGVFTKYSVESLTFIKEGYWFLKDLYRTYEMNAVCELHVYEFNFDTRTYSEFPDTFSLDFTSYKVKRTPNSKLRSEINIKCSRNSDQVKFENRKDIDVDLTKFRLESGGLRGRGGLGRSGYDERRISTIGGFDVVDWTGLRKNINIDPITIINNAYAKAPLSTNKYGLHQVSHKLALTSIPLEIAQTDFDEVKAVPYVDQQTELSDISPVFDTALYDYDLEVKWQVIADVIYKNSNDPYTIHLDEVTSDGEIVNSFVTSSFGATREKQLLNGSASITISQGNSLKFYISVDDRHHIRASIWDQVSNLIVVPGEPSRIETEYTYISFKQSIASSPERVIESLPLYEALERNLQMMLDKQFPLYSEYLGRTEVVYDLNGNTYSSEDQLRFVNVMSGLNLRGASLDDHDAPVTSNFEKLFHGANCVYNLGYGWDIIGGINRLRIENYSWFFDDTVILDISDRIDELDIESEVLPKLAFSDIQSGYKKFDYEKINGRGEFNTTNKRTSIINTSTKFDNVSDIRADTRGIMSLIATSITDDATGSTDQEGDNDLFFIKTQRDGSDWKNEKQENITVEDDSSIFGSETFNLFLSPTRNLRRHDNKIKSSLTKYESSKLRFQTSEKLQTLKTTGEGYTIIENDDISVNVLDDPIYKPMQHTVTVKLTYDERALLVGSPLKRIKFTDSITGWLLKYKRKNATDEVELIIIEKYV